MKRPSQPSGEALSATQIIQRVVTHPTQVVDTLRRRPERVAARLSDGARMRLLGVGAASVVFGLLVGLLGLLSRSVWGTAAGFTLIAAGMSVVTLVDLLSPERPTPDEAVWDAIKKWSMR